MHRATGTGEPQARAPPTPKAIDDDALRECLCALSAPAPGLPQTQVQFIDDHRPIGILDELLREKLFLRRTPERRFVQGQAVIERPVCGEKGLNGARRAGQAQLGEQLAEIMLVFLHGSSFPGARKARPKRRLDKAGGKQFREAPLSRRYRTDSDFGLK